MTISCIIVEDEPVSQDVLTHYIADIPRLNLVAVCNNAIEASEVLMNNKIQVMFLDINMPKLSGLDFLRTLQNPPFVIFTTAYSKYALEGFEVNAIDYLLKPFSFERFLKAVNKAAERLKVPENENHSEAFILLKADKKIHKVNISDILYLESMGDYVKVFYKDSKLIVHDTLQSLQVKLPANTFIRVHKSYIISTVKFNHIDGNTIIIGRAEIPIGQKYKNDFLKSLK